VREREREREIGNYFEKIVKDVKKETKIGKRFSEIEHVEEKRSHDISPTCSFAN
jgi:hypothetical protein